MCARKRRLLCLPEATFSTHPASRTCSSASWAAAAASASLRAVAAPSSSCRSPSASASARCVDAACETVGGYARISHDGDNGKEETDETRHRHHPRLRAHMRCQRLPQPSLLLPPRLLRRLQSLLPPLPPLVSNMARVITAYLLQEFGFERSRKLE
jgi:hypothetical protein